MALHNLNNENEVVPMVNQTTSATIETVGEEDCPITDEVATTDEVESNITKDFSTEQVVNNNTVDSESRSFLSFLPDDKRVAYETKVELVESIIKFHENGTDEEVVKDHIIKTFDGLDNNPHKSILGEDGSGWFALYLLMKACSDDVDKMKTLHRGLQTLCDIPRETGVMVPSFDLDYEYEKASSVVDFASRIFKLGATIEASESSNVDQVYNDTMNSATEVSREALKEASRVSSSSGGGYSDSFDIWDVLKWGAVAVGAVGVGYLAYKGYQALTDDNPNDVVFIDMDDYDMEQPAFL